MSSASGIFPESRYTFGQLPIGVLLFSPNSTNYLCTTCHSNKNGHTQATIPHKSIRVFNNIKQSFTYGHSRTLAVSGAVPNLKEHKRDNIYL